MAMQIKKRGDLVAEQIKGWIVSRNMVPGQKFPLEAELTRMFGIGKGSVREALKSLEVQGIIRTTAGQRGGSFLVEVPEEHTMSLLQNFFYFKKLTPEQLYEMRRTLEPKLAASVALTADAALVERLEQKVELCRPVAQTREDWQRQLQYHIDFHDILASGAENPLMCFHCKFINKLLRHLVQRRESRAQRELIRDNFRAHVALLAAIRRHEPEKAEKLMLAHILTAESYFSGTKPTMERRFLPQAPSSVPAPPMDPNS